MHRAKNSITLRRSGRGTLAEITVAATIDRVWSILTSFEEMPEHLSGLRQSRILKKEGDYRLVEQTAKVENRFLPLFFRVVLEVFEERPFLYFSQRNGTFTSFRGYWRIDSTSVANESRIRYYLETDVGGEVRRRLFEQQLRRMIRQNMQELAVWIES